jgi:hypothetical protein
MTRSIETYVDRLTSEHKKPKFEATFRATLQPFIDLQNLIASIPSLFDLDTAVGAQLDVVGEWVNISRTIEQPMQDPWFRVGDAKRGLGAGAVYQPFDSGIYLTSLSDDVFRRLIKARIKALHWDGTSQQARAIILEFFAAAGTNFIIDDRQTMDVFYAISGAFPDVVTLEVFGGDYLPLSAAGVRTIKLVTSVDGAPIFGVGVNNGIIGGLGAGAVGVSPRVAIDIILQNQPLVL